MRKDICEETQDCEYDIAKWIHDQYFKGCTSQVKKRYRSGFPFKLKFPGKLFRRTVLVYWDRFWVPSLKFILESEFAGIVYDHIYDTLPIGNRRLSRLQSIREKLGIAVGTRKLHLRESRGRCTHCGKSLISGALRCEACGSGQGKIYDGKN